MKSSQEAVLKLDVRDCFDNLARAEPLVPEFESPPLNSDAKPVAVVAVGSLAGFTEAGLPEVDFPKNTSGLPVPARTTVEVHKQDIGRQVVLGFEEGDIQKPIILGLLRTFAPPPLTSDTPPKPLEPSQHGEQVVLSANKEIVLRCGKASITLTRAGKVIIRGAYLLSRSSGVNRIKGGSVQIN